MIDSKNVVGQNVIRSGFIFSAWYRLQYRHVRPILIGRSVRSTTAFVIQIPTTTTTPPPPIIPNRREMREVL